MTGSIAEGRTPIEVAIKDLNGDGWLDIVTANVRFRDVTVLLGNGDGTFPTSTLYDVGISPHSVAIEDMDGDGRLDLISSNYDSNDISVLFGNGNGGFGSEQKIAVGTGPRRFGVGDVNGDGRPDILAGNSVSNDLSIILNLRDGQALQAQTVGSHQFAMVERLNQAIAAPVIESAKLNWHGLGIALSELDDISFVTTNLPGTQLGYTAGNTIFLDEDAAGWGWFIDQTPDEQEEFELRDSEWITSTNDASNRMDLLTVVAHELGHLLGLDDSFADNSDLMSHQLTPGTRRLPTAENIDQIFGSRKT